MTASMKYTSKALYLILLLVITNCSAIPGKQKIMPDNVDQIGLFTNGKTITIENNKSYFIGTINGDWSKKQALTKLGLEFVDITLSSDKGVYLIGGTTFSTPDGIKAYRGRTVLINSLNKIITQWNYNSTFNSAGLIEDGLIGSTGNNIYRLKSNGSTELVHKRKRSTLISIVLDDNDNLIICNPYELRKSNTPFMKFGCYKGTEWEFEGQWYNPTIKFKTNPISCGKWLIEATQKEFNKKITRIKARNLSTGKLINEREVPGANHILCINNKSIMLNTSLTGLSLPDLAPAETYTCHNNEPVKSIKQSSAITVCLTEKGNIGKLLKK